MANKTIALVAHDNRKRDLIQWVSFNCHTLSQFNLVCTGTTGSLVEEEMQKSIQNFQVNLLKSGPMGGDLQMGSLIANGEIDFMIFLWDPMSSQPHDVDVKALLRVAVVYYILWPVTDQLQISLYPLHLFKRITSQLLKITRPTLIEI